MKTMFLGQVMVLKPGHGTVPPVQSHGPLDPEQRKDPEKHLVVHVLEFDNPPIVQLLLMDKDGNISRHQACHLKFHDPTALADEVMADRIRNLTRSVPVVKDPPDSQES